MPRNLPKRMKRAIEAEGEDPNEIVRVTRDAARWLVPLADESYRDPKTGWSVEAKAWLMSVEHHMSNLLGEEPEYGKSLDQAH